MSNIETFYQQLISKDEHEPEFLQAVKHVFDAIKPILDKNPNWEANGIIERMIEPDRIIIFRVPWVDDNNQVRVNRGYRVQFNNTLGPYKGGLRFHPTVNLSILKFLGFEQTFKNALTGLPLGGAKGGSDFDPKGKSDFEILRFCQSFMTELYRHIGASTDVPAGDIGVGKREIGYLYGMYKKLVNRWDGTLTGKGLDYGGSLARKEATGYGLCYFMEKYLNHYNNSMKDKVVIISGSGNVAIYACEKAQELGTKVVAMSDSKGVIYDKAGIDLALVKELKEVQHVSLENYKKFRNAVYYPDSKVIWSLPCEVALPCATQNELDLTSAKQLVENGCLAVGEGANMPCTPAAVSYFIEHQILYAPGKAANAGGVAVSGLEMSQNSERLSWSFERVDQELKTIMESIFEKVNLTAFKYGFEGNMYVGANIVGFSKVANAMCDQGVI